MLPWYEFCLFNFYFFVIPYIIAWYAQISWTPTYHITMPAARRAHVPNSSMHAETNILSTTQAIHILPLLLSYLHLVSELFFFLNCIALVHDIVPVMEN
jgi:hypothetical protein